MPCFVVVWETYTKERPSGYGTLHVAAPDREAVEQTIMTYRKKFYKKGPIVLRVEDCEGDCTGSTLQDLATLLTPEDERSF